MSGHILFHSKGIPFKECRECISTYQVAVQCTGITEVFELRTSWVLTFVALRARLQNQELSRADSLDCFEENRSQVFHVTRQWARAANVPTCLLKLSLQGIIILLFFWFFVWNENFRRVKYFGGGKNIQLAISLPLTTSHCGKIWHRCDVYFWDGRKTSRETATETSQCYRIRHLYYLIIQVFTAHIMLYVIFFFGLGK